MGREPKSGRLKKMCEVSTLVVCTQSPVNTQCGDFYSLRLCLPHSCLPSLHSQIGFFKSPSCQVMYTVWQHGVQRPSEITVWRDVLDCPAGTLVWQEGGAEDSRAGSKGIRRSVCWACRSITKGKREKFPWRRLVGPVFNVMPCF